MDICSFLDSSLQREYTNVSSLSSNMHSFFGASSFDSQQQIESKIFFKASYLIVNYGHLKKPCHNACLADNKSKVAPHFFTYHFLEPLKALPKWLNFIKDFEWRHCFWFQENLMFSVNCFDVTLMKSFSLLVHIPNQSFVF